MIFQIGKKNIQQISIDMDVNNYRQPYGLQQWEKTYKIYIFLVQLMMAWYQTAWTGWIVVDSISWFSTTYSYYQFIWCMHGADMSVCASSPLLI